MTVNFGTFHTVSEHSAIEVFYMILREINFRFIITSS